MKDRFCRMLGLLTCMVMALLVLCAGGASAEEKSTGFLGQPFPEFTVTDIDGNTFNLSEAVKSHEAVLINFWATWCGPCMQEFPFLGEAFEKYGDRVAFIALTVGKNDTMDVIRDYRETYGVKVPLAIDEDQKLADSIHADGVPDTVIVDRFGNAVFYHESAFLSADEVSRVLDRFLGDGYTETKVLDRIPRDASTMAFPVSAARAVYPASGDYQKIIFHAKNINNTMTGWIVPDDLVIMQVELTANDDVASMMYGDTFSGTSRYVKDMLDPKSGTYACEQMMPLPEDEDQYVEIMLYDGNSEKDIVEEDVLAFLVKNEESIEKVVELLKNSLQAEEVTWEYADESAKPENALQAYIVHVVDQDNNPVEGVAVNFCTDKACVPKESDGSGTVTFTGEKAAYHVQIVDAPEGYSWDESYEMYTTEEYGEWTLRIRKD